MLAMLVMLVASNTDGYHREDYLTRSQWTATHRKLIRTRGLSGSRVLDAYQGDTIPDSTANVDHIVPLHYAHLHGASKFTAEQKHAFANDTLNLAFTRDSVNTAKGDKPWRKWTPKIRKTAYIARFRAVMAKYNLK